MAAVAATAATVGPSAQDVRRGRGAEAHAHMLSGARKA